METGFALVIDPIVVAIVALVVATILLIAFLANRQR
jgi:hypothetical protein